MMMTVAMSDKYADNTMESWVGVFLLLLLLLSQCGLSAHRLICDLCQQLT